MYIKIYIVLRMDTIFHISSNILTPIYILHISASSMMLHWRYLSFASYVAPKVVGNTYNEI